jgi:hypothetical protein
VWGAAWILLDYAVFPRKEVVVMANPKLKRRVATLRGKVKSRVERIEEELPPELRQYAKRMRHGLSRLEKQIASAQADAHRRFAHLLREASHQLGRVEALGEREWRKRTTQARRDAVKLLRRLEKAIEPRRAPRPRRRPAKPVVVSAPAPTLRRSAPTVRASALAAAASAPAATPAPTAVRF